MEETYNHHHHHAHAHGVESPSGIFILSIALNAAFVAVEAAVGFWQGTLSLLSDAGHNLGDVFSLLLVLADLACRVIIAPVILPVGAVTSFLGAPVFLYLLLKGGGSRA